MQSDIANIAAKGLGWAFFVGALGFATASLVGNSNLVTKIFFPREVLPLSSVGAQARCSTRSPAFSKVCGDRNDWRGADVPAPAASLRRVRMRMS